MTQVFTDNGRVQPVTVIEAGPCVVTQIRDLDRDGYEAVQVGYGTAKHVKKPVGGHIKAAGLTSVAKLTEFRTSPGDPTYEVGQRLTLDLFQSGDFVDVIGTSKGKGFTGVMKRHGFRGGPRTHGQSDRSRAPGSIGPGTTPGRVFKGTRMAGRTGNERRTVLHLAVIRTDPESNVLLVKGSVPGPAGGFLLIRRSNRGR
ncbi:MAG: 50S ribosomal protein L3 [Chloroflexi bacterium]|nr:50S ribosomal protein L3 [Chloroflexota bacterium]MCL4545994.1 50S ribosomal protein L3 [Chloroflexota bacterium]